MYEIPQPLKHQEQIMFGLTAKQLLYAVIGIFPCLLILKRWPNWYGLLYVVIPVSISLAFMFFNAEKWIKAFYQHIKVRKANFTDKQLKKLFVIKEASNKTITVIKGKEQKLAVIYIKPLNFGIKTDDDKNVILLQFQRFLNALDFPIQIIMTTKPIKLNKYLNQIKKSQYPEQQTHYKEHLNQLSNTEIKNRHFYIVIPEVNKMLDIQVDIVMQLLNGMGLKARRIGENEAIMLFQHYLDTTNQ